MLNFPKKWKIFKEKMIKFQKNGKMSFFIKNAKIFKKWGNVFYKMLMLTFSKKWKMLF